MRSLLLACAVLGVAAFPASATAAVPHTVQPGETLWSIAAANSLYTGALAAFNGLPADSAVTVGSTIMVPSQAEALPKVNEALAAGKISQPCECVETAQGSDPSGSDPSGATAAPQQGAPPPAGAYTVQAGDTFSSLAAKAGVQPAQIAGVNGLSLDAPLLAGTTIKLPPASAPAQQSEPAPAPNNVPQADPAPAPGRVTSGQVQQVASQNGVDGSLAAAIGWQESGFNNAMVSSANARGVMQVMPGTWDWVQRNLADRQLDPNSAVDNVHAGTLYLRQMLRESGGDPAMAAAGYYQGLGSVKKIGMLPETQRYVENVMALRSKFGG
jgi:soluble lytic murein transglycosylase-like protein